MSLDCLESATFRFLMNVGNLKKWTGSEEHHITLMLNVAAKNFLVESYPGASDVLTDCQNGTWLLDAKVHSLDPISRFYASWIDKVQIYSDEKRYQTTLTPS